MCHRLCDIWLLVISFSCDVLTGTLVVVRLIVRGRGRVRGYLYTHWGSAGMVSNHR